VSLVSVSLVSSFVREDACAAPLLDPPHRQIATAPTHDAESGAISPSAQAICPGYHHPDPAEPARRRESGCLSTEHASGLEVPTCLLLSVPDEYSLVRGIAGPLGGPA
jgi:hypothetical protein